MCATKKIVGERWTIVTDNANECYRILTARNVQEHDGIPEQVWIANVFELEDAVNIVKAHNSDYAKSCDDCIYGVDGCQHKPPCTTGTGKPYYKKRDFT